MKKILLCVLGVGIFGVLVYATGGYTYFQKRIVAEDLPIIVSQDSETPTAETEPQIVKEGVFVDADFLHTGEGIAKIIVYPDGSHILRFEEFSVVNGPDVYVYLSRSTTPTHDSESLADFIDLGPLKGNIGDQNYELPPGAEDYQTVVLWCKKFDVLFPYAVMTSQSQ